MWAFRIRMDDTFEEYTAAARRYPLVELRPMKPRPPVRPGSRRDGPRRAVEPLLEPLWFLSHVSHLSLGCTP